MEAKNINSSKPRNTRTLMGCSVLLLGVPLLLYFGYCWGLWGRHSLLLQYFFQCKCPAASEQARYPKEAEVIVSACRSWTAELSPAGSKLYVREKTFGRFSNYLLNFQTNEIIPIKSKATNFDFLNDELLFRSDKDYIQNGGYVLDGNTGIEYPIKTFREIQSSAYVNNYVNTDLLLNAFREADKIILLDTTSYPAISLSADFREHPEHSFVIYFHDIEGTGVHRVEQLLQHNNIYYVYAPSPSIWDSYHREVVSPDGKLIAKADGIYLSETNQRIAEGIPNRVLVNGWTNNGYVIYSSTYLDPCLFRFGLPMMDDSSCVIVVPQPVLKFKVPDEYWSSNGIQ